MTDLILCLDLASLYDELPAEIDASSTMVPDSDRREILSLLRSPRLKETQMAADAEQLGEPLMSIGSEPRQ